MTTADLIKIITELAAKDLTVDEADILAAAVIAGNEVAMRTDITKYQYTLPDITLTSGTFSYAIPDYPDFDRMKTVVWVKDDEHNDLNPARIEEIDPKIQMDTTAGTPEMYSIWEGKIWIWRTNSGTLKCKGLKRFNSVEDIDDKYIHLLVEGILKELYRPVLGTTEGLGAFMAATEEFKRAFTHLTPQVGKVPLSWGMTEAQNKKNRKLSSL